MMDPGEDAVRKCGLSPKEWIMSKVISVAAKKARTNHVVLLLSVAAAALALSLPAQAACNIRGEHCGRPAWAVNAFSNPRDRVPEEALEVKRHQSVRPSKPAVTVKVVKRVPASKLKAHAIEAKTPTVDRKIETAENPSKAAVREPAPTAPASTTIRTAEHDSGVAAHKPTAPAVAAECKKYFPNVGQMISVPCAE